MISWPDNGEALLEQFVEQRALRVAGARYGNALRRFQYFVGARKRIPLDTVIATWMRKRSKESPPHPVLREGCLISAFLSWLVERGLLPCNPIEDLRRKHRIRSTTAVLQAMMTTRPETALCVQAPPARYGSHLGTVMREHVERMQTLGFRYNENRFLHFDRFLQRQPDAASETFTVLIRRYSEEAGTAVSKLNRLKLGRALAGALSRKGAPTASPGNDPMLVQEMHRKRRGPYIYTEDEIWLLLKTASSFPSPNAPLRPATLYTMVVLGYCAGLRIGEIVGLQLKDVDLRAGEIEIRDSRYQVFQVAPVAFVGERNNSPPSVYGDPRASGRFHEP